MDEDDERSAMVWEFARLLGELAPKAFVMGKEQVVPPSVIIVITENVDALAINARWESVRTKLLATFKSLGYRTRAILLNAKDFGVPQSRSRVFFVGTRKPYPPVSVIEPADPRYVTVHQVLKDLPPPGHEGNTGWVIPVKTTNYWLT